MNGPTQTPAPLLGASPRLDHPGGIRRLGRALSRLDWSAYGIVVAMLVIWLVFNVATGGLFLSPRNLTYLAVQAVILGIGACGMVLVMVAGHIDLSIGSAVGLTATVAAYTQVALGWPGPLAIVAAVAVGVAIGIWQGGWVAFAGIPAFIVTLAGLTLLRGLTYLLTNGQTYAPMTADVGVIAGGFIGAAPSTVLVVAAIGGALLLAVRRSRSAEAPAAHAATMEILRSLPVLIILAVILYVAWTYRGIPIAVLIFAVLALSLAFVATRTRFGRHLYAIGGGREAAILAGINTASHTFVLFVGMGALYGLAGVVLASRLNGAPPDPALGLELDCITAAIIGGTSLMGGVGTIQGAILGAILLTSVSNGMDLIGMSSYFQFVVKGLILLLAVLLDMFLKRRQVAA
jgi:D-xylose transport system permease protein